MPVIATSAPLISLVTLLPITVNGVGIREGAFIYFFSRLGTSSTEIFLLLLTVYLLIAVLGLIGGIGYLLENIMLARRSAIKTQTEDPERLKGHAAVCQDQTRPSS